MTTDGQPGYKKAGADTVYPFSSVKQCSFGVKHQTPAESKYTYAYVIIPSNAKSIIITVTATDTAYYYIYQGTNFAGTEIFKGNNVKNQKYDLDPTKPYYIMVSPKYFNHTVTLTGMAYF